MSFLVSSFEFFGQLEPFTFDQAQLKKILKRKAEK